MGRTKLGGGMLGSGMLVLLLGTVGAGWGAVDVAAPPAVITSEGTARRTVQTATLANEINSYTLVYDYNVDPAKPGEATSTQWGWTVDFIPIGMTAPSICGWYWQAFINWKFDDEDLSKRPASFRVVRGGGTEGEIEYAWDTPKVRATLRFALASGSDKLLVLGNYEPKVPVKVSRLTLTCYPAAYELPHNRAVTTAAGTTLPGQTAPFDLATQRWALYEDVTPGRTGSGSCGLIVGTPGAFSSVEIPVGDYGITTTATLKPEARSFAVGLYEFPSLPEYEATRAYFRKSGDAEAAWLGAAAAHPEEAVPAWPMDQTRYAALTARYADMFNRPAERWTPDPAPLAFSWAHKLPGGAIKTVLFVPRYRAWETMELARRLEMDVSHLYWDGDTGISLPDYWPYAGTTGVGGIPLGVATRRAVQLAEAPGTELYFCPSLNGTAIPGVVREAILAQVKAGKGLLLVGPPGRLEGWPKEIFQNEDAAAGAAALAGLDWDKVPGFSADSPPVAVYHYGQGRVVVLTVNTNQFSALCPGHKESEGLEGIFDHQLAVAARAALVAAGREVGHVALDGERPALWRLRDVQDRVVWQGKVEHEGQLLLPTESTGRAAWLDEVALDDAGNCAGYTFFRVEPSGSPTISAIQLAPAEQPEKTLIPAVKLAEGGTLHCSARLEGAMVPAGQMTWEVSDAFDRVLARKVTRIPEEGGTVEADLTLTRPVTVEHRLDLTFTILPNSTLAVGRQRFTVPLPYPYDDFTALMWCTPGGERVMQHTDRLCYEWGADMMDLCHVGGYDDAQAAREFSVSARSGMRLVPYITWVGGTTDTRNFRDPGLSDPGYRSGTCAKLVTVARQAAPYRPAGYTLGDEIRLSVGPGDCDSSPASVADFRRWLQGRYPTIGALNQVWDTNYGSWGEIQPMLEGEAAGRTKSFAPWIEHKLFMDTSYADTLDLFADTIRGVDPGAKVGYDGIETNGWTTGWDAEKLTRHLDLNQVYDLDYLPSEEVRKFKQAGALSGKWGNSLADVEGGWHAFPWDCLLAGDNSVWWWTSWGCEYIPFNPDLSQSNYGKWFYEAAREVRAGPGKLLLHAEREQSGVGVLYAQANMFMGALLGAMEPGQPLTGDWGWRQEQEGLVRGVKDYGCQERFVGADQLEQGLSARDYKVFFLPLAVCLSDAEVTALRRYVEEGGTLVVDGRAGYLTGAGQVRATRALEEVLGVKEPAGVVALRAAPPRRDVALEGTIDGVAGAVPVKITSFPAQLLEPALQVTTGQALATVGPTGAQTPCAAMVVNRLGKGRAITVNLAWTGLNQERTKPGAQPLRTLLAAILQSAGVAPFCQLRDPAGGQPLVIQQVSYREGGARYLALFHDFLVPDLGPQPVHVTLPAAAVVYDLRAGKRLGAGKISEWDATLARGYPLVYALLPYEVTGVTAQAPASAVRGTAVPVGVRVQTAGGAAGFHVVRLNVYAPGASLPHREYSQNVSCPEGAGQGSVPLALNDAVGTWELELVDVATGVKSRRGVVVR